MLKTPLDVTDSFPAYAVVCCALMTASVDPFPVAKRELVGCLPLDLVDDDFAAEAGMESLGLTPPDCMPTEIEQQRISPAFHMLRLA
jgi:hypothetical protein